MSAELLCKKHCRVVTYLIDFHFWFRDNLCNYLSDTTKSTRNNFYAFYLRKKRKVTKRNRYVLPYYFPFFKNNNFFFSHRSRSQNALILFFLSISYENLVVISLKWVNRFCFDIFGTVSSPYRYLSIQKISSS